jgi:hypothetical protein
MITFTLEDIELWDIVHAPILIPPVTTPVLVAELRKRNIKEKRNIFDGVRDHVIPHLTGKDYAFEMWDYLCNIYQSPNQNKNMLL